MLMHLASQLAVSAHAHAGSSSLDHRSRQPHIHVSRAEHHHAHHSHTHAHGVIQHRHTGGRVSAPNPFGLIDPFHDHDSDAIYLPTTVQAGVRNSATGSGADQDQSALVPAMVAKSKIAVSQPTQGDGRRPSIAASVPHCALYLTLRSLRI
jgi:hypothetical protein